MTTCLNIHLQNLQLVLFGNYILYLVHSIVDVHIKEQSSTEMHGLPIAATASLLGIPSHTWFIQPLDELPIEIKFYLMESKTNMAHPSVSIPA